MKHNYGGGRAHSGNISFDGDSLSSPPPMLDKKVLTVKRKIIIDQHGLQWQDPEKVKERELKAKEKKEQEKHLSTN